MAKKLGADFPLLVDTKDACKMAEKVHAAMGCEPNISIECSGAEQSVQTGVYVSIQCCLYERESLNIFIRIVQFHLTKFDFVWQMQ